MEKDIDRIQKNPDTDIVIRVDDFGGKPGLTIREFVKSDRYTGFTKAGTRIPAEHFTTFKKAINSINESDFEVSESQGSEQNQDKQETIQERKHEEKEIKKNSNQDNYEELEM